MENKYSKIVETYKQELSVEIAKLIKEIADPVELKKRIDEKTLDIVGKASGEIRNVFHRKIIEANKMIDEINSVLQKESQIQSQKILEETRNKIKNS